MKEIKKVCVIGSGQMGAGIAAQIANSGIQVLLLDIVDGNSQNRNNLSETAVNKMLKCNQIAHPDLLSLIKIGNLEDDLESLKTCDWVIEVILEKLEIKHQLYQKIIPYLNKDTIISSNTSTLSLDLLKKPLAEDIRKNFMITHFFNPPRIMRLLELVIDKETNPESKNIIHNFLNQNLGKGVVICNDTPGFIANRVGCFLMELVLRESMKRELSVMVIDHIFHKLCGMPRTGIFGLMDLIGLDLMPLMAQSLLKSLPEQDRLHQIYYHIDSLDVLIKEGYNGRKGKGGFYQVINEGNEKVKYQLNLQNWQYEKIDESNIPSYKSLQELLDKQDEYGQFMRDILVEFGNYVANLIPEVTEDPRNIDKAMRLGYNWKYGPFELIGSLDNSFKWLLENITKSILKPANFLQNKDFLQHDFTAANKTRKILKRHLVHDKPLIGNDSANLWLIDDDICCLEFLTPMNSLANNVFHMLKESIKYAEKHNTPLIIYNDSPNFSSGANLKILNQYIKNNEFNKIEQMIITGQQAMQAMKYASIPIISCAKGFALGGGAELLLHSHYVVANLETHAGLVEMGVGLIPGWGGIKESIMRNYEDSNKLEKAFELIINQNKTPSAYYLTEYFTGLQVQINMNVDLLLSDAIALANKINKNFTPRKQSQGCLLPNFNLLKFINDKTDKHHSDIIKQLNEHLQQYENINEQQLLSIEQEIFLHLVRVPETATKINKII